MSISSLLNSNADFPIGLKVLAFDSDSPSLFSLVSLLQSCNYQVMPTVNLSEAIERLRETNNAKYDIVIADIKDSEKDGFFSLFDLAVNTSDLPIIVTSEDESKSTVMKCIKAGACAYILKPIRIQEMKIIWQHVIRSALVRTNNIINNNNMAVLTCSHSSEGQTAHDVPELMSSQVRIRSKRISWTRELHAIFLAAIQKLGNKALPKDIHAAMNVPGLTRASVASHLQNYRGSQSNVKTKSMKWRNRGVDYRDLLVPALSYGMGVNSTANQQGMPPRIRLGAPGQFMFNGESSSSYGGSSQMRRHQIPTPELETMIRHKEMEQYPFQAYPSSHIIGRGQSSRHVTNDYTQLQHPVMTCSDPSLNSDIEHPAVTNDALTFSTDDNFLESDSFAQMIGHHDHVDSTLLNDDDNDLFDVSDLLMQDDNFNNNLRDAEDVFQLSDLCNYTSFGDEITGFFS